MRSQANNHAFTLIELLVVIAIIGILAAVLFPVFAQARASARKTWRLSNLRQIGMSTRMYMEDYDELFPQTKSSSCQPQIDDYDGSLESPDYGSIFSMILPYTGHGGQSDEDHLFQQRLYACPDDPTPFDPNCPNIINIGGPHVISYLVNAYFVWGLSDAGVARPAETIIYTELRSQNSPSCVAPYCDDIYHPWLDASNPNISPPEMDPSSAAMATDRHVSGMNYVFVDGHSAWKRFSQTFSPPQINLHTPGL